MHHAAPARVESSHSEEEDESHARGLSLAQPPPLPPKPGDVLRSYISGGGRSQSASVVHIGGKSVITTTNANRLMSPPPPLNCTEYVEPIARTTGHNTLKQRKEGGTRPSRFVAATMSKATSMMAAVSKEFGLKSGGASKSSHSCSSGNSVYGSSTTRRVKCRPSQSLNPQGSQGYGINGIQGNPPPYRHPPVAPSLSEGPWRTLRSRGVTVHQWQPRRYECRPPAEESYV